MRHALPRFLSSWLTASVLLLGGHEALAGDVDDTVYLRNGGRVRGVVLEENPTLGLKIRLPDGSIRSYEPADVHHVAYGSDRVEISPDAYTPHSTVRFGVGGEPVLWYVPAASETDLGARAFGRMSIDLSPLVAVRLDLGVGALGNVTSNRGVADATTTIPISVRGDLQLNVARHYSVGLGVDLGVDIYRTRSSSLLNAGAASPQFTIPATTDAEGMLGLHLSLVTLRFGQANQFQVAAQDGVLFFLENGSTPVFEQTISFTYLFGAGI